jgi:nucleoside phosphorylase
MINDAQVVTKCNVCAQGDYVLSNEVVLEDVPVQDQGTQEYVEELTPQELANQKLLALGLTQEEIEELINQASQNTLQEPTE